MHGNTKLKFSWRFVPLCADVFKFTCPKVAMTEAQQHPRYADPDDCQYFYVCINGDVPRRNGCKTGQVFNDVSKTCDWPRNVPEWWVQRKSAGVSGVELPGTNTCKLGAALTQSKYWFGYSLDGPEFESWFRQEISISLPQRPDRNTGPCSLLFDGYRRVISLGVKQPGRDAKNEASSGSEVKTGWIYTSISHTHVFMARTETNMLNS